MKKLLLIAALAVSNHAIAEVSVFGGFYAFNEEDTKYDYAGHSPLGEYGIQYTHHVDEHLSASFGWKHQSSAAFAEIGDGFNGIFMQAKIIIFK